MCITEQRAIHFREESDSEEEGEHEMVGVGELMTNIFGEDSDDEKDDEDSGNHDGQVHVCALIIILITLSTCV